MIYPPASFGFNDLRTPPINCILKQRVCFFGWAKIRSLFCFPEKEQCASAIRFVEARDQDDLVNLKNNFMS